MDLTASFRYLSPAARLYAGVDALSNLYRRRRGWRRPAPLWYAARPSRAPQTCWSRTRESLGDLYAGVFDGAKRESPIPSVMAGVEAARDAQADVIVAVGGGSAVVTARAITILMAEDGTPQELCTKYPPGQPPVSPPSSAAQAPQHPGAHHAHQRRKPRRRCRYGRQAPVQAGAVRSQGAPNLHHPGRRGAPYRSPAPVPGHGHQHLHRRRGRAPVPGTQPLRLRGPAAGPGAFPGVPAQAGIPVPTTRSLASSWARRRLSPTAQPMRLPAEDGAQAPPLTARYGIATPTLDRALPTRCC